MRNRKHRRVYLTVVQLRVIEKLLRTALKEYEAGDLLVLDGFGYHTAVKLHYRMLRHLNYLDQQQRSPYQQLGLTPANGNEKSNS